MRILLVHNFYRSTNPSGENRVVEGEVALLRARGHEVETFFSSSDDALQARGLTRLWSLLAIIWNERARRRLEARLKAFRPEVVHFHNTFPFLSPALYWARRPPGVKFFLTFHNYRAFCLDGTLLRRGALCMDCKVPRHAWKGILRRCYQGQALGSLLLGLTTALHRALGSYRRVQGYFFFSAYQRQILQEALDLPPSRGYLKANALSASGSHEGSLSEARPVDFLYLGRLSSEKGVITLAKSFRQLAAQGEKFHARILGGGVLLSTVRSLLVEVSEVSVPGEIPPEAVGAALRQARYVIIPSECVEGLPMVLLEALAAGARLVVSDRGPLPEYVADLPGSRTFPGGDGDALADCLAGLLATAGPLLKESEQLRSHLEAFSEPTVYGNLIHAYRSA